MKSAELSRISGNYNRYDAWCVHCGFAAVKLETLGLVKRRIAEHDASGYCAERGLEVAHYVAHKPDNRTLRRLVHETSRAFTGWRHEHVTRDPACTTVWAVSIATARRLCHYRCAP